ncbi:hypothetical protein QUF70_06120 [Desulfobacterales bacterium HSG17]|nr:hypothetical protein [Desulfobacterales bacterium HSG17]
MEEIKMEFERYYLDLFEMLNSTCKNISSGRFEQSDANKLFELSKMNRYPSLLAELAESFGMMLVRVEAREFERSQFIQELEEAKAKLEDYSQGLEKQLRECSAHKSKRD